MDNRFKTSAILFCAGFKLIDPKKWTRQHFVVDAEGYGTYIGADNAYAFCAIGAVRDCVKDKGTGIENENWRIIKHTLDKLVPGHDIFVYNDDIAKNNYQVAFWLFVAAVLTLFKKGE